MVVGIDASGWSNRRGFGRFTRSLVHALVAIDRSNDYVLFFDCTRDQGEAAPAEASCVFVATSESLTNAVLPGRHRRAVDLWRMSAAVREKAPDVLFFPSIDGYFPPPRRMRTVVTIHDLIPEREPHLTVLTSWERFLRRCKVRLALRQADRIVTGSERCRADICAHFGLLPDRVTTVPYGADPIFRPPNSIHEVRAWVADRFGFLGPYLLCVAAPGPHKNLGRLLAAFAGVGPPSGPDTVTLLVVGQPRPAGPEHRSVRFLGYVSDADLVRLYQGAEAVIVPSLREGFGLPAIEAAACGTPVLAARGCPSFESLGEAALGFSPDDTAEMRSVLERFLRDARERERLRCAARNQGGAFDWRRSAERALAVLTDVAARRVP